MSRGWSAERMAELAHHHAAAEARGDLEETMATLVAEPVYEFHPTGLTMRGGDRVRRYYTQFFEHFVPKTVGYRMLEEWVNETSLTQEYEITLRVDGTDETFRVIGTLFAEGELLGGERIFSSERFLRQMAGAMFDELEPSAP
jgi:hypothetical protein